MSDFKSDDKSYYETYYDRMGESSYTGEGSKNTSRMLVFQEWLRKELKPGAKVLDIGCGDAIFAELMPEFEWYGVDINVDRAIERIPYQIDQEKSRLMSHNLMQPPYPKPSGCFDAIVCSEVLEHLWDLRVVHREAKRLLKRNGLYVISTPNFDWITNHLENFRKIMQQQTNHWAWEHIRHYNYDNHKTFLNECGFVIENHTGADAHYCPIFSHAALGVQKGMREKGIEVSEAELHKMMGEAVPYYQHTIILSARKA